jgi:ketosteroid isomerase-like protein
MTHEIEGVDSPAPTAKEVAERGFDALSRRDIEGVLEVLDPMVELIPLLTGPDDRVYHGHDGARRWLEEIWGAWAGYRVTLRWAREVDERTTVIEWIGTLRRHDADVELETTAYGVMERGIDTGRVTRWRFFATEPEAFAAAEANRAGQRTP